MKKALIISLILLGGCQTTTPIGEGPIPTFSPAVKTFVNDYFALASNAKSLAISADGQAAGASHCALGGKYGAITASQMDEKCGSTDHNALNSCRQKSGGSKCYIYAWGNQVVWKTSLPSASMTPVTAPPATTTSPAQTRSFIALWEGVGSVDGTITFSSSSGTAQVMLTGSNNLTCDGIASFSKGLGAWAIKCADGISINGNFKELSTGIIGEGRDSHGRKVAFTVPSR